MANTCFEVGQIIEGSYNGRAFKYRALKEGVEGSGSVYGPGMDLLNNRKVFLKKYTDPGPRAEWFAPFIEYHRKLRDRINAIRALGNKQTVIAGICADTDVWGVYRGAGKSCCAVLHIEDGQLTGRETQIFSAYNEESEG